MCSLRSRSVGCSPKRRKRRATNLHLSRASYSRHTSPPKTFLSNIMNKCVQRINHLPQVFSQIINKVLKNNYHPQFFFLNNEQICPKNDAPGVKNTRSYNDLSESPPPVYLPQSCIAILVAIYWHTQLQRRFLAVDAVWLTILHVCFEHCLITAVSFLLWDVNIFCTFVKRLHKCKKLKQYKMDFKMEKALSWSQGFKMWESAQSLAIAQNTLIFPFTDDLDFETWCTKTSLSLDKHLLNVCKKIRIGDGQGIMIWFEYLSSVVILLAAAQTKQGNCCPAIHVIFLYLSSWALGAFDRVRKDIFMSYMLCIRQHRSAWPK